MTEPIDDLDVPSFLRDAGRSVEEDEGDTISMSEAIAIVLDLAIKQVYEHAPKDHSTAWDEWMKDEDADRQRRAVNMLEAWACEYFDVDPRGDRLLFPIKPVIHTQSAGNPPELPDEPFIIINSKTLINRLSGGPRVAFHCHACNEDFVLREGEEHTCTVP